MSEPNHTTADQLDSLLREGRISESDYERLREALDSGADLGGESLLGIAASNDRRSRQIPPVLWVGLVMLGIIVLLKIVFVVRAGPLILIDAALSAVLLVGLYSGHKWAYAVTIVYCVGGALMMIASKPAVGAGVLVMNTLVLVPVLISTRYFFPEASRGVGGNEA